MTKNYLSSAISNNWGSNAMQPNYPTSENHSPHRLECWQKTLTQVYKCLIQLKLDYSCFIYEAARESYIQKLENIYHQGPHIFLGAFTTSPIESLYIKVNELPLSLRTYKPALQYYTKLISCLQNPVYNCIMEIRYKNLFENKAKAIKLFNLRI